MSLVSCFFLRHSVFSCIGASLFNKLTYLLTYCTDRAGFGMEAFFDLSYTVVQGNAGICKTSILSSETVELCPKLRTLKISPRHIARQNVSST